MAGVVQGKHADEQGRYEEAVWHNREAIRIKPDCLPALSNLAVSLSKAGRPQEAIRYFEKALEISPSYVDTHLNIAVTLTDKGDPGTSDTIGITLWDGNKLLFSSDWRGSKTFEDPLGAGNLVVH